MPWTADALLAHADWVQELARSLASDAHAADDLVQEAWLAALQRPPKNQGDPKGWLSAVVRNLSAKQRRAEARRSRREALAARPLETDATDAIVHRLTAQRALVEAVLGLEEPYRTAITMRYLDGLPPRQVARELGVPVATVHTRLGRGIERMRHILDRRFGGRRPWCLALLGARLAQTTAAVPLSGVLLVNTKAKSGVAAMALLLGSVAAWPFLAGDRPAATPAAPLQPKPAQLAATARRADLAVHRTQVPTPADQPEQVQTVGIELRGMVIDLDERPVAGVAVIAHRGRDGSSSETVSDTQGRFVLGNAPTRATIAVRDARFATVFESRVPDRSDLSGFEPLVVVAEARTVHGLVRDELGAPIDGANVAVEFDQHLRNRFSRILDDAETPYLRGRSDAGGAFAFPSVGRVPKTTLTVAKPGYVPFARDVSGLSAGAIDVMLKRPVPTDDVLAGHVTGAQGAVVPGALVALGHTTTRANDRGAFLFRLSEVAEPIRLVAFSPGHRPASLEAPRDTSGQLAWPGYVSLQLAGPPKRITGRIIDAAGHPIEGARVWARDRTGFGYLDGKPTVIEPLLRGVPLPGERQTRLREASGGDPERMAELDNHSPSIVWSWVPTDASGRFILDGLLDRDYQLRAMHPATLLHADSQPVPAGTEDVTIALPTDTYIDVVSARIRTHAGAPVAGVEVQAVARAAEIKLVDYNTTSRTAYGQKTETDADGRFELRQVPANGVYLRIQGRDIMPRRFGRELGLQAALASAGQDPSIAVDLRMHFKVELLGDVERADQVRVLTDQQEPVTLTIFQSSGWMKNRTASLERGTTATIAVPQTAAILQLFKGTTLVQTLPITLRPGQLNHLRL
ncbi:MAG: sigma-70 family RNA polymerase sigma factor [Planctomycetota bacterium]